MKNPILPIFLSLCLPCVGLAQAVPTAVAQPSTSGLNLPPINGTFQYGLNAAEIIQKGYFGNGGYSAQTSLSGDLEYASGSERRPLELVYTGGAQIGDQSGTSTTFFQSLALSQGYNTRNWGFNLTDLVSYLPQSPTVGLSGIPGTGDVGLIPVQSGLEPSQNILTIGNSRVSNSVEGSVDRRIDAFTSVKGSASYGLLRFLDNGGLDSTQLSGELSINRRIDARSSASLAGTYGSFQFSSLGNGASFVTRGLNVGYQRQLSRSLNANVTGGPEWISSSAILGIPSRLTFSATADLEYSVREYHAALGYNRNVNGGSGVQAGGITDSLVASLQRSFGEVWSASANFGYARTRGLSNSQTPVIASVREFANNGNYDSVYAGGQVSHRIGRFFSGYVSYTALDQTYSATQVTPSALSGVVQSFAIGVSYFPRSLHMGRF